MFTYDRNTLTNFVVTSSEEEIIDLDINMPEWNAEISVAFTNVAESRMQGIPPEIGEIQLMSTQMTDFSYEGVIRTPLRLEECAGNSLLDHPAV